jgi:hypothetical protein
MRDYWPGVLCSGMVTPTTALETHSRAVYGARNGHLERQLLSRQDVETRIADKAACRTLNRDSNKGLTSPAFLHFVEHIEELWFRGKASGATGREGIFPAEIFDNGEISFVLREGETNTVFSTALMDAAESLVHKKAFTRLWRQKAEADPLQLREKDYQPTEDELAEVRTKLASKSAWVLDRHQYRKESLLDLSALKKEPIKKVRSNKSGPELSR